MKSVKSNRRHHLLHREERRAAWLFLLPSLLGISILILLPFVETARRSLYNAPGTRFVGLENYRGVLKNEAFELALRNTGRFLGICVPLLLVVSLVLALLVRRAPRGKSIFRTTFLLPMAIPVASICLLWKVLFAENGLINSILSKSAIGTVDFLGSNLAFWVLILTYLWKNAGYDMILWLAGMDGISRSLYEAAEVDGANAWQQFRFITLPGLIPTLSMITVLSLLNTFKVFREAYLVAGAYPHESMYMLQHLFNNWFRELDLGRLTAGAVLMATILLGLILLLLRVLRGGAVREET